MTSGMERSVSPFQTFLRFPSVVGEIRGRQPCCALQVLSGPGYQRESLPIDVLGCVSYLTSLNSQVAALEVPNHRMPLSHQIEQIPPI
jgi:hypothetical protein